MILTEPKEALNTLVLIGAGLIAGALNAAAGGGSFITLPALIYTGVPAIGANTSSTVGLFPGAFASTYAYRNEIQPFKEISLRTMIVITLTGGALGALLLLITPPGRFSQMIPWLLLTGSIAFAFGRTAGDWLRRYFQINRFVLATAQFLLGIYGGYFGGAVGIMMMAVWSLFNFNDIKTVNANKTLLVGAANGVAVIIFIIVGQIWWQQTLILLIASTTGGYFGARFVRLLNPQSLRIGISIFNFLITLVFFLNHYI